MTLITQSEKLLELAHQLVQDFHISLNEQQQFAVTAIFHRSILIAEMITQNRATDFTNNVSIQHDIANLMTPVIGYTHLLISGKLGTLAEFYESILNDLLGLAHSIDGQIRLNVSDSPVATR